MTSITWYGTLWRCYPLSKVGLVCTPLIQNKTATWTSTVLMLLWKAFKSCNVAGGGAELPGRWLSGGGPGKLLGLSSLGGAVPQRQAEGRVVLGLLVTQLEQVSGWALCSLASRCFYNSWNVQNAATLLGDWCYDVLKWHTLEEKVLLTNIILLIEPELFEAHVVASRANVLGD